jgi:hypothetical protein
LKKVLAKIELNCIADCRNYTQHNESVAEA